MKHLRFGIAGTIASLFIRNKYHLKFKEPDSLCGKSALLIALREVGFAMASILLREDTVTVFVPWNEKKVVGASILKFWYV